LGLQKHQLAREDVNLNHLWTISAVGVASKTHKDPGGSDIGKKTSGKGEVGAAFVLFGQRAHLETAEGAWRKKAHDPKI